MSNKAQRKKLAKLHKNGKVVYKSYTPPDWSPTRNIPVATKSEVSRSPYFAGQAFEPKDRVEMFPVGEQDEGETAEEPSEEVS